MVSRYCRLSAFAIPEALQVGCLWTTLRVTVARLEEEVGTGVVNKSLILSLLPHPTSPNTGEDFPPQKGHIANVMPTK